VNCPAFGYAGIRVCPAGLRECPGIHRCPFVKVTIVKPSPWKK
jgi:hypothetical protein